MDEPQDSDPRDRFRTLPQPVRLNETLALHDAAPPAAAVAGLAGFGMLTAPDGGEE